MTKIEAPQAADQAPVAGALQISKPDLINEGAANVCNAAAAAAAQLLLPNGRFAPLASFTANTPRTKGSVLHPDPAPGRRHRQGSPARRHALLPAGAARAHPAQPHLRLAHVPVLRGRWAHDTVAQDAPGRLCGARRGPRPDRGAERRAQGPDLSRGLGAVERFTCRRRQGGH